jgi:hypothetical protein
VRAWPIRQELYRPSTSTLQDHGFLPTALLKLACASAVLIKQTFLERVHSLTKNYSTFFIAIKISKFPLPKRKCYNFLVAMNEFVIYKPLNQCNVYWIQTCFTLIWMAFSICLVFVWPASCSTCKCVTPNHAIAQVASTI